jgi:hypothetical protein
MRTSFSKRLLTVVIWVAASILHNFVLLAGRDISMAGSAAEYMLERVRGRLMQMAPNLRQ